MKRNKTNVHPNVYRSTHVLAALFTITKIRNNPSVHKLMK